MTGFTVDVEVGGFPVDPCKVALPLEIVHGRSSILNQPDAPTCSFMWADPEPPGEVGWGLAVVDIIEYDSATWADPEATWDSAAVSWGGEPGHRVPRFTGTIDNLTAHELGGQVVSWDVSGVGWAAALGYDVWNASRPAEYDTVRVAALAEDAITVGDPIMLAATVYEGVDVLSALHDIAASTGGLVWQDRAGLVNYGTGAHRDGMTWPQVIDCEVISDGVDWVQDMGSVINSVTVKWGATATLFEDLPSISLYGRRAATLDSMLAGEADAEQVGALIMSRRKDPHWDMPQVVVYADQLDQAGVEAVSALEVSSSVEVPIPFTPGPTPADLSYGFIEGWVETWDEGGHTIQFAVSDASRWTAIRNRTWAEAALAAWGDWSPGNWTGLLVVSPEDL